MKHASVGTSLSQVEWEAGITHVLGINIQTSAYEVLSSDSAIVCNSTTAFTLTLPVATGSGKVYYIKNVNTGVITIDGNTNDTIDGELTQYLTQYESAQIADYAANKWMVI